MEIIKIYFIQNKKGNGRPIRFRMPNQEGALVGEASDYHQIKTSRRIVPFLF